MEIPNKPCMLTECINNIEGLCRPDLKHSKWCEKINYISARDTVKMEEGLFFYKQRRLIYGGESKMNKKPLTQKELQEMAGKPVYCPEIESYGIVKYETIGIWAGVPFLLGACHRDGVAVNFEYNILERKLRCYRINEN